VGFLSRKKRLLAAVSAAGLFLIFVLILVGRNLQTPPGFKVDPKKDRKIIQIATPQTYNILKENLKVLAEYAPWIKVSSIGKSVFGREIFLVKMGQGAKSILMVGGIHGREWLTGMMLTEMIQEYAAAAEKGQDFGGYDLKRILEKMTLLFVPVLNPDGVEIALQGLKAGGDRKLLLQANEGRNDFRQWKANGRGVNLNIQYDAHWEEAFSTSAPHHEKYKGTHPESEPESKAIVRLVASEQPEVILCYHSSGEVIYWYYGQEGKEYKRDLRLAEKIAEVTGYRLAREEKVDTHGGLKDWFIHKYQKPGYTIEIGESMQENPLPVSVFARVYAENKETPLLVAQDVL